MGLEPIASAEDAAYALSPIRKQVQANLKRLNQSFSTADVGSIAFPAIGFSNGRYSQWKFNGFV